MYCQQLIQLAQLQVLLIYQVLFTPELLVQQVRSGKEVWMVVLLGLM